MTAPRVAVVVPCTRPGRIAGIADALALEEAASGERCQLIVVGSVGALDGADFAVDTDLVPCDDPHPNERRCRALARSRAPIVAFLDDDAVPRPGWLAEAASLPSGSAEVWTGPEEPLRTGPGPELAAAVAASVLAEGSRAHIEVRDRPVAWFEVPFCNLVTSRAFLDEVGWPRPDIPWDIDDFAWCRRASGMGATFRNRSALRVAHDRYPDEFATWLGRKARDRRRTGEKLVHHPALYAQVPGVAVAAVAPVAAAVVLAAAGRWRRRLVVAGAGAYVAGLAVESLRSGRRGLDAVRMAGGLAALHAVSVAAMEVGVVHALATSTRRRADRPDAGLGNGHPTDATLEEEVAEWAGRC